MPEVLGEGLAISLPSPRRLAQSHHCNCPSHYCWVLWILLAMTVGPRSSLGLPSSLCFIVAGSHVPAGGSHSATIICRQNMWQLIGALEEKPRHFRNMEEYDTNSTHFPGIPGREAGTSGFPWALKGVASQPTTQHNSLIPFHPWAGYYLGLDNLSRGSSLKKTDLHSLISHWMPVAFHLHVGPCEVSPIHVGMSTGMPLCRSCLGDYLVEISWVQLPCHVSKSGQP